ncbi:MAG TPA: hypothetical protein VG708_05730 [Mycobacteriales bacterium]|nr:hypothetical protein [Mycobacteriales bacterium]
MAEKVLVVGGLLNVAYGLLLGLAIVRVRTAGAPATPRYLHAAHIGTFLQAAVLFGLVWAVRLSDLGSGWQQAAAWLVVIASGLVAVMDTFNWLTGVQDAFAEKSKAVPLGALAAIGDAVGVGILLVGVLKAL